jgi:4-hydroxy-tetrahydrodipicolinate reductase
VVAFQAMVDILAQNFPGAFAGYRLEVIESHQRAKADTSGTAKAVVASFAKLGTPLGEVRVFH